MEKLPEIYKEDNKERELEIAKLSKSEILELLKDKNISERAEILKVIPKETYWSSHVDQSFIQAQKKIERSILKEYGPQIGTINVENRESHKKVSLPLHCKRKLFNPTKKFEINEDGEMVESGISDPEQGHYIFEYFLLDERGNIAAFMRLDDYPVDAVSHQKNIQKNLLNYSGNPDEQPVGFTYIDEMGGGIAYKGCGTALHQIAVEHSLRNGFDGRVQLLAAGFGSSGETPVVTSAGFHESFGYIYKDVFDKEGTLHHQGASVHEELAKSRWQAAKKYRNEHPNEPMPQFIKDNYRPTSDAGLYAYLPEEIILREKERMLTHQNLKINLETFAVLENSIKE